MLRSAIATFVGSPVLRRRSRARSFSSSASDHRPSRYAPAPRFASAIACFDRSPTPSNSSSARLQWSSYPGSPRTTLATPRMFSASPTVSGKPACSASVRARNATRIAARLRPSASRTAAYRASACARSRSASRPRTSSTVRRARVSHRSACGSLPIAPRSAHACTAGERSGPGWRRSAAAPRRRLAPLPRGDPRGAGRRRAPPTPAAGRPVSRPARRPPRSPARRAGRLDVRVDPRGSHGRDAPVAPCLVVLVGDEEVQGDDPARVVGLLPSSRSRRAPTSPWRRLRVRNGSPA